MLPSMEQVSTVGGKTRAASPRLSLRATPGACVRVKKTPVTVPLRGAERSGVGGAAGAVPVLIGWAAVTHSLSMTAVWMFLIIFLWTPPHFWALSLTLKHDYARAGVPMLPVVKGEHETHRQIVLYTGVLIAASLALVGTHAMVALYLVGALLLAHALLPCALPSLRAPTLARARTVFWFSNYYLALLFALMVLDSALR